MLTADQKPKRGRPPVYGKRRPTFSFRITEETKQRLIESAMQAGRSISEEIEFRINRDLDRESRSC
jgi:hypothetical protein